MRSSRGPRDGAAPDTMSDGVRDRVAVRGADGERLQDEHVERPLEELALHRWITSLRHTPQDNLPENACLARNESVFSGRMSVDGLTGSRPDATDRPAV